MVQFFKVVGLCVLLLTQCAFASPRTAPRQLTIGYLAHDVPLTYYRPRQKPKGYLVHTLNQALASRFILNWQPFISYSLGKKALKNSRIDLLLAPIQNNRDKRLRVSHEVFQEPWVLASLNPLSISLEPASDPYKYAIYIPSDIHLTPFHRLTQQPIIDLFSLNQGTRDLHEHVVDGIWLPAHLQPLLAQRAEDLHFQSMPQSLRYGLIAQDKAGAAVLIDEINQAIDKTPLGDEPLSPQIKDVPDNTFWQWLTGALFSLLLLMLLVGYQVRSKNRKLSRQIHYFSQTDKVTGLPNGRKLQQRLAQLIKQKDDVGIFLFEFSRQDEIAESYGMRLGLQTRRAFGQRSRKRLLANYPNAELYHWRDHLFVMLLPEQLVVDYAAVANAVALLCRGWLSLDNMKIRTRSHVGWSSWPSAQRLDDAEQLINQAYIGFLRAVSEHKRICQFQPEHKALAKARLTLEAKLRYAVDHEQLMLYFQPQFSLVDQSLTGAEVLVRWRDSDGKLVSPGSFIPLAEQTGLIVRLDHWVYERSMETLANWFPHLPQGFRLSVNLSAVSISRGICESMVMKATRKWNVDPRAVCLEVTESSIMNYPELAKASIQRLRHHGFDIAIDDFGTGYSSMSYLKYLPVTHLKIDQSFTAGLQHGQADQQIVRAIATMGQSFGYKILIEGVEVLEQAKIARRLGCEFVQGFHFARPMNGAEFIQKYLLNNVTPSLLTA